MTIALNAVCMIVATTAVGPVGEVRQLSGESVTGSLVEVSDNSVVIKAEDDSTITVPTADLLGITPQIDAAGKGPRREQASKETPEIPVVLADGSRLRGSEISVTSGEATIASHTGEAEWRLPSRSLASVRFVESSPTIDKQWDEIASASHSTDVLVVKQGEGLDYLEGVLGDVTVETVQFDLDGDELTVKLSKVAGLLYYQAPGAKPTASVCQVLGRDQTSLMAGHVSLAGEALHVTTVSGVELDMLWSDVRYVDFSLGKVTFLSDMEPEVERWTPYFEARQLPTTAVDYYTPRRDKAFDGQPLLLAGRTYSRGLAIRSRTELAYRLPGKYRRFVAMVGIDDRMRPLGHVKFQVYADQQLLLDREISGGDEPVPVDLDLTGATRLRVVVDFGQDLDISDHFNLCDARIVK